VVFKRLRQPYLPGERAWRKYRVRDSTEAVIGAITGTLAEPRSLLLGRYDTRRRLHCVGSSGALSAAAARGLTGLLTPADEQHPWRGRVFATR
jgi:ATP-dependent DNA ligase